MYIGLSLFQFRALISSLHSRMPSEESRSFLDKARMHSRERELKSGRVVWFLLTPECPCLVSPVLSSYRHFPDLSPILSWSPRSYLKRPIVLLNVSVSLSLIIVLIAD